MIKLICRALVLCTLPYLLHAQFRITSPQTRSVIQRDVANRGHLLIAGKAPNAASTIEARLIPMVLGQGTPINWTTVATANKDSTFRGNLTALGGWYRLEIRAKVAAVVVADTAVSRVGVGEVFIIAGQSNAQGGIATNVPAATDDRVSCVDLYQRNPIDTLTFPFMFSHVSEGANIGPSNSPYLWGILGDSLTKRLNVPVLFLGAAQSGSNSTEWRISALATPAVLPYQRLSAALLFYTKRLGMRAVLWHQGESDPNTSETGYFDNISIIINKSRQQLSHSSLAWLVSRASYISGATNSQVIAAQNRLSNEVAEVYAGPATDGLIGPDNRVDDIHFGGQGLLRVANLWNQSLTDQFFSTSKPFVPVADSLQLTTGWQAVITGVPFTTLQRVGYYYESASHRFFLLAGATAPLEGRLERLDGDFADTAWALLTPTANSTDNNPGFSDYKYLRFYNASPGRYRLAVRMVGDTGPGYRLETVLRDFRNTLFIGNEPVPTKPLIGQADLSLVMQADRHVVAVGQPVTIQLLVSNKGPQAATHVRLQSRLPAGLSFISGSPQASVTALNGVVTVAFDTLPPFKTQLATLRTLVTASGQYVAAAQVIAADQFDPNSTPGTGTADGEDDRASVDFRTSDGDTTHHESPNPGGIVLPVVITHDSLPDSTKADLSLAMQLSASVVAPGASLTIVCSVKNRGGLVATNVGVQVVLPVSWKLLNFTDVTLSGQTVSATLAKIPVGSTVPLTLVVRTGPAIRPAQLMAQITRSDQADPNSTPGNGYNNGEDDEASAEVTVVGIPIPPK